LACRPGSELLSFPAGKHDDQVDALGLVGQLLDLMAKGRRPDPPPLPNMADHAYQSPLDQMDYAQSSVKLL
jgi:hypothetical protein